MENKQSEENDISEINETKEKKGVNKSLKQVKRILKKYKKNMKKITESYVKSNEINFTNSMKVKLISTFLLIIIVPMIIVTIYSITSSIGKEKTQVRERLQGDSVAAYLMLKSEVNKYDTMCKNIANDDGIKIPLGMGNVFSFQLGEYLQSNKQKYKNLKDISVYDQDGMSFYGPRTNIYDKFVKSVIKKRKEIKGFLYNKGINIVSINPVLGDKNKVIGIVVIAHNLNKDPELFKAMSSSIDCSTMLINKTSTGMMSSPNGSSKFSKQLIDKSYISEALKHSTYFDDSTVKIFDGNYFIYNRTLKDILGRQMGVISVADSNAGLNKNIRSIFFTMFFILFISIIFTVAAAVTASKFLTNPIIELIKLMKKVEKGDLTVKSENHSDDEIGRLAMNFNNMTGELKNVVNTISKSSNQISNVSGQVSVISEKIVEDMKCVMVSINNVKSGAENNSASVQETTAGLEEINTKAVLVAQNTKDTQQTIQDAYNSALEGKAASEQSRQSMSAFSQELKETADSIKKLEYTTNRINSIIEAVSDIEAQTHMLALNASIEAARAGEAGRGFAVVADEMGKLSMQTKNQVNSIRELTDEISAGTNSAVTKIDNNVKLMENELENVSFVEHKLIDLVNYMRIVEGSMCKIAEAVQVQAESTSKISSAMEIIGTTTTETATTTSVTAETINDQFNEITKLSEFVEDLNKMSKKFKNTVGRFVTE